MENEGAVDNITGNVSTPSSTTNCTLAGIPSAQEMFLLYMSVAWSQAIVITMSILSFLTCLLFVESAYSTKRSMEYGTRRGYTMFILGLVPVFSVTSLTGIFIPSSALVGIWASSVYLSISLYIFLMLIFNYFGGPDEMVAKLATTTISLAQAPLACCCPCCCRKIRLTSTNLHRLRVAVLQMALVQPLAYFIAAILWADGLYNPSKLNISSAYLYLSLCIITSTFTAMYALTIINVAADASLSAMYGTFRLRFSLLKFFMIVPSLQGLASTIISQAVPIPCEGFLSPSSRASLMYNILVIIEMFLLLLIGRGKSLLNQYYSPLRQAGQADSLNTSQAQHRYAEVRVLASPLLDAEGNKPSFPTLSMSDEEKVQLELLDEKNHNEREMKVGESPSRSRVLTIESDV